MTIRSSDPPVQVPGGSLIGRVEKTSSLPSLTTTKTTYLSILVGMLRDVGGSLSVLAPVSGVRGRLELECVEVVWVKVFIQSRPDPECDYCKRIATTVHRFTYRDRAHQLFSISVSPHSTHDPYRSAAGLSHLS
ncbi:hypothetical protein QAD02_000672 [Eretmocerus hayati]|uniref:Uncharacterized protein n=1 Tax=Eretmocerus hayati TaxID=131215 RepID=A0ACC2NE33_9HYME|nr:hypothetical protein QAD02_000672 [Eretmocerus hayati]